MATKTKIISYKEIDWFYTIRKPKPATINISKYVPSYIKQYLNCPSDIPVEQWSAARCVSWFSGEGIISDINQNYKRGAWSYDIMVLNFCNQNWCSNNSLTAEIKIEGVPIETNYRIIDKYFAVYVWKVDDTFIYYRLHRKFYAPTSFQKRYIPYVDDKKYIIDEQYNESTRQLTLSITTPDTYIDLQHDASLVDKILLADTLLSFDRNSFPNLLLATVMGGEIFYSFTTSQVCYYDSRPTYCCGRYFTVTVPVCFPVPGLSISFSYNPDKNSIIFNLNNFFSTFFFYPHLINEQTLRILTICNPIYQLNLNQPIFNLGLNKFPIGNVEIKIDNVAGATPISINTKTSIINIKELEGLKI